METLWMTFLQKVGTEQVGHVNTNLYDHLWGTYRYLVAWGCEEGVCRAGLFHSIYGTTVFKHRSIGETDRPFVQRLIGKRAEELAHLFSIIDRPAGLITAISEKEVAVTATKEKIPVSNKILEELIEIEIANLLEQRSGRRFFQKILDEERLGNVRVRKNIVAILKNL